jgi:hypothetical protein
MRSARSRSSGRRCSQLGCAEREFGSIGSGLSCGCAASGRAVAAGVERNDGPAETASVLDDMVDGLRVSVSVGALGARADVDGLGASVVVRRIGAAGGLEVAFADRVRVIGLRAATPL